MKSNGYLPSGRTPNDSKNDPETNFGNFRETSSIGERDTHPKPAKNPHITTDRTRANFDFHTTHIENFHLQKASHQPSMALHDPPISSDDPLFHLSCGLVLSNNTIILIFCCHYFSSPNTMVSHRGSCSSRLLSAITVVAALAYVILTICEDTSLHPDISRRVLSLEDETKRRDERAQLRRENRELTDVPPPILDLPVLDTAPPEVATEPVPEPDAVLPEPIDKAADIAALSEEAARAQKNRLIMKEFVRRSRAARTRTGLHQGPISHDAGFMALTGDEGLQAYEEKPHILNDGTYLIFQNSAALLFIDKYIKPNLCSTLITEPQKINRVHYHGGKCKVFDSQFGNRLGWMYGMKMLQMLQEFRFTLRVT
jgi:hypothetical protein